MAISPPTSPAILAYRVLKRSLRDARQIAGRGIEARVVVSAGVGEPCVRKPQFPRPLVRPGHDYFVFEVLSTQYQFLVQGFAYRVHPTCAPSLASCEIGHIH